MHLIFRYDDFSAAERQSYEIDAAVFQLFWDMNVPLVVGVTPRMARDVYDPANTMFHAFESDTQRLALLQQGLNCGWQLALHGYTHQRTGRISGSEFADEPREVQQAKIRAGVSVLRQCFPSTPIEVFIPPWNSFDQVTLDCLAAEDFRIASIGAEITSYNRRSLLLAPSLLSARELTDYVRYYSLADLIKTVGQAALVVTLHEYEFRLTGRADSLTVSDLAEVLQHIRLAGVPIGTLSVADINYTPRYFRSLQAKVFLLQQVARGRGKQICQRAHSIDRRWNWGGAVSTLAGAWWLQAQAEALIRRPLGHVKQAYRRLMRGSPVSRSLE